MPETLTVWVVLESSVKCRLSHSQTTPVHVYVNPYVCIGTEGPSLEQTKALPSPTLLVYPVITSGFTAEHLQTLIYSVLMGCAAGPSPQDHGLALALCYRGSLLEYCSFLRDLSYFLLSKIQPLKNKTDGKLCSLPSHIVHGGRDGSRSLRGALPSPILISATSFYLKLFNKISN